MDEHEEIEIPEEINYRLSPGMRKELKFLVRSTGQPVNELFRVGISYLMFVIEGISKGGATISHGPWYNRRTFKIKLGYELKEPYSRSLPNPELERWKKKFSVAWFTGWFVSSVLLLAGEAVKNNWVLGLGLLIVLFMMTWATLKVFKHPNRRKGRG